VCGNKNLQTILSLGKQCLTGVFPKTKNQHVTSGPLDLVKCDESQSDSCGQVQLKQSYDVNEMYGSNYGYRSGLNASMVRHLYNKVKIIQEIVALKRGDLVIDIGSNDGTLLSAYPEYLDLIGIDPTISHFAKYYPNHIQRIPDFFSSNLVQERFEGRKAKVVTSIAMFYDLESPMDFVRQVTEILDNDGVWAFEQSYLPTMLNMNAYDTICHEHLEYYGLRQIKWMIERSGLKFVKVELNQINGGSFSVMVAKSSSRYPEDRDTVNKLLDSEKSLGNIKTYEAFANRVYKHREELLHFFKQTAKEGKKIVGYGASTKGNVVLQFCGLTPDQLPCIGEVNEEKFGSFTPGTLIPIVSEQDAKSMKPDYLLVLPWHFKDFLVEKEKNFLMSGGKLVFGLPELCIVGSTQR